jgi:uncharacterized GH25 family protein
VRANFHGVAILCGLVAASAATAASAHEFWMEPSSFAVEQGGRIAVRLCIGDGYEGWSQARNPARIVSFVAAGPAGQQPVVGLDGADPAGALRLVAPGDYVIAYRSDRAFTEMPAVEFDTYLRDKGLDRVIAHRQAGATGRPVREAYSRHAKALVHVGEPAGVPADRAMQLPLELIAETESTGSTLDGRRRFRLLHQGKPLAGALVAAVRPGTPDEPLEARTDPDGRVEFRLQAAGRWRIAAVHMFRPSRGVSADWESLWASLTFEWPTAETAMGPRPVVACRNRVAARRVTAAR